MIPRHRPPFGVGCVILAILNCLKRVDTKQVESKFAEALKELSCNSRLCQQMGTNARTLAEREFDRDKLAMQTLEVIASVQTSVAISNFPK